MRLDRVMTRPLLTLILLFVATSGVAAARDACVAEINNAGRTVAKIFRQWPLRPSADPVTRQVQSIATQLAERAAVSASRRWRIHVVRDSKLNAFSGGDGHVFVTEGMLRFVNSEAELSAVLAHEFGHHLAGHFCGPATNKGFWGNLFGSEDPRHGQTAPRRQVGSLTALVDPEKEQQADHAAVILLRRAAINPQAALDLARRISTAPSGAHFQYGDRLASLQSALAQGSQPAAEFPNSEVFLQMKAALRADARSPPAAN